MKNSASFDTKIVSLPIFSGYDLNLSYIYHTMGTSRDTCSLSFRDNPFPNNYCIRHGFRIYRHYSLRAGKSILALFRAIP